MSLNKFDGYKTVKETENFAILLNPHAGPTVKDQSAYYLIYKPLGSIEFESNSIVLMYSLLPDAERSLAEVLASTEEEQAQGHAGLN